MDKEKENEQIWICGKYISHSMRHNKPEMEMSWEFAGCFSTEEKAIKACPNDQYFIAPANIDEIVPVDASEWTGAYYPKAEKIKCCCDDIKVKNDEKKETFDQ